MRGKVTMDIIGYYDGNYHNWNLQKGCQNIICTIINRFDDAGWSKISFVYPRVASSLSHRIHDPFCMSSLYAGGIFIVIGGEGSWVICGHT